jgi:hypothetical protein
MNHKTYRLETARRRVHSTLKWLLSALSAAVTTSFVILLEVEA